MLNFSIWIGCGNTELAQEVAPTGEFSRYFSFETGKSPLQKYLKFGLLRSESMAPFLWGLSQDIGADIALTGIPCRLGEAVEVVEASSYEILAESPPQRSIELEFSVAGKVSSNLRKVSKPALRVERTWSSKRCGVFCSHSAAISGG